MNNKRSYLDTLNEGRQRKVHTSIEALNRTLDSLGERIERSPALAPEPPSPANRSTARWDGAYPPRETADPSRSRQRAPEPSYQSLARDIERMRNQEDGVSTAGRIATELKELREELRHQMTAGLKREFQALHQDIQRAYAAGTANNTAELGAEFERLSDAIRSLADRSDDKGMNLVRLEMEQVKKALDTLSRDESARSTNLDRRWSKFEDRYETDARARRDDPAIRTLSARLDEINSAVNSLPESLSLQSLEDKVRTLATAVDHFVSQQEQASPASFTQIEERLDEISRAIVASAATAAPAAFDPQPFERIEARISSLARQIEELVDDRPSAEVIDRLNLLSQRVDEIAARGKLPEKAIEKLASQIAMVADLVTKQPAMPDADHILRGLEERFEILSDVLDRRQGKAMEHGQTLFRDLERRIDDVVARLDTPPPPLEFDDSGIMQAIDQRFAEFSRKLDVPAPEFDDAGIMQAIDTRFAELTRKLEARGVQAAASEGKAISNLETRLDDIAAQLDASAMKFAGIDPGVIRSLEKQVAGLAAHLTKPAQPLPELEDLGPRLEEIERSISKSRDTIVETAREAAENAVRSFSGTAADSAALAALADDLKSLDLLSRQADERNTKTFEAIHDTLLKIVERLGSLEVERQHRVARPETAMAPAMRPMSQPLPEPERKPTLADAPSIAPAIAPSMDAPLAGEAGFGKTRPEFAARRTPAEAAAAAAVAAMDAEPQPAPEASSRVRSMLGGLTRKFAKKERVEPAMAEAPAAEEPVAAAAVLDQPIDPKLANRPLEPGSGAPDLSAIMRRVRDERGQPVRHSESETAKSDFIAAARRAAQAAAAEADIVKRGSERNTGKGSRLDGLFGIRRKPVLLAAVAILVALAGLQLGKAFLRGGDQDVANAEEPVVIEDSADAGVASLAEENAGDAIDEPVVADMTGAGDETEIVEPAGDETVVVADEPIGDESRTVRQAEPVQTAAIEPADAPADASAPAGDQVAAATSDPVIQPVPAEAGPLALREAAEQGDAKALFEIGSRFAEARGVKEDMTEAAKWYERSAELGLAPAQYRIGNFYEKGMGVERDIAKAKTWYQMAAEQGNASAMHNLAVLFAMGAGGTTDNDSAARWFLEAAELGVKDSQFNLGILSAKGVGMEQNLEESYKWFALVAKAGDKDAAAKRDEIANALRPEQLTKARAATELWKPRALKPEANTVDVPDAWREGITTTASVDMRQAVRNIQLILNKNGYDAGSADGLMGEKTKSAIAAFQEANGMEPTGDVTETLVKALLEKK